ncbi:MAG: tRNA (adenosine(37)-N6)-threonylcarbamoyltransferase complex dimerization subunit type 1 TsaB, partial [Candidatus Brocadiales bacterium]
SHAAVLVGNGVAKEGVNLTNMKVLGIETSGLVGSVALCEDSGVLAEKSFEKGMRHGKALVSSLEDMFQGLGLEPEEIDLIAISHGPGSYTGLRVGVTCAKVLAYTLGKPLVAVPTLDVLAENAPPKEMAICPVLDARRKQVYACIYKRSGAMWQRSSKPMVIYPQKLLEMLPRPVLTFGDGTTVYKEVFTADGVTFGGDEMGVARARVVARLGKKVFDKGEISDPYLLQPLYLRVSEAEEKWEARRMQGS